MKKIFLVLFCVSLCVVACNNKKAANTEPEATECCEAKKAACEDSTKKACCAGDSTKVCCKADSTKACSDSTKVCPGKEAAAAE